MTLDTLTTRTRVQKAAPGSPDMLVINNEPLEGSGAQRFCDFLALVRQHCTYQGPVQVYSENNFPTGAGVASSASGFAALALALSKVCELDETRLSLSTLARIGSGSAARSLFGGFVLQHRGQDDDGSDCFAESFLPENHWPLRVVVAVCSEQAKDVSSRAGMNTGNNSPFFNVWIGEQDSDLVQAKEALMERDLEKLSHVAEHNCLKMHSVAHTSHPALMYWNAATVACMHAVWQLRREGVPVFFTIDAGPQLKAFCLPEAEEKVQAVLAAVPGVLRTLSCGVGAGARVVTS